METKYFTYNENTTAEDLKQQFRELSKKYHPDKGGDHHQFTAMKAEYDKLQLKIGQNEIYSKLKSGIKWEEIDLDSIFAHLRESLGKETYDAFMENFEKHLGPWMGMFKMAQNVKKNPKDTTAQVQLGTAALNTILKTLK